MLTSPVRDGMSVVVPGEGGRVRLSSDHGRGNCKLSRGSALRSTQGTYESLPLYLGHGQLNLGTLGSRQQFLLKIVKSSPLVTMDLCAHTELNLIRDGQTDN